MRLDGALSAAARVPSSGADADVVKAQRALEGSLSGELDAQSVGESFSELFGTMLARELRKSGQGFGDEGGLFGKGAGADVYEGWFDQHLGTALSQGDALGIVGMIKAGMAHAPTAQEA